MSGFEHFADDLGLGLGIGLLRACGGDLRIEIAELLRRQGGIVRSDQEIGIAAERRDLGLGVGDPLLHGLNFARQPIYGRARLILLGRALAHQIFVRDGVGDIGGKLGSWDRKSMTMTFDLSIAKAVSRS